MHPIVQRAEILLQANAHPSLKLDELVDVLRREMDQSLTPERLLHMIGEHPKRFRVLESWRGGWRSARGERSTVWIVAVGAPAPSPDAPPSAFRLRESVRWLACGLDERSRTDISRWYAITLSERETRRSFVRRAG